ncbi:MAG: HK97 family phage prohead protease, partial [Patescibacteria group bacterium]|nr:HK97 family phage prohead protease [Patescibacteria group bacterium]
MKLYKILGIINKKIDEAKFTLEAIFSTEDEDRHGDVIKQNWNLKDFKKNPVIINSHNYYDAAEVIGRAEKISIKDGQLQGKIKFAVNENPRARVIFDLYANGFLNAFSVGFIPKEFDDKGIILKSELLEISAVSVPANAMALAKAKGIDVNKLYESTNNDNFKNKKNDGKNAKSKNNDGKNNGEKGDDKNKKSKGNEKNKGDG